jgi:hypothetical protein
MNDSASASSSTQPKGIDLNNDFASQAKDAVPEPEPSDSSDASSDESLSDNSANCKEN